MTLFRLLAGAVLVAFLAGPAAADPIPSLSVDSWGTTINQETPPRLYGGTVFKGAPNQNYKVILMAKSGAVAGDPYTILDTIIIWTDAAGKGVVPGQSLNGRLGEAGLDGNGNLGWTVRMGITGINVEHEWLSEPDWQAAP